MAHPEFQVKAGKHNQFYFNLTAKNGQIILSSEGYNAKVSCENGVAIVKRTPQKIHDLSARSPKTENTSLS